MKLSQLKLLICMETNLLSDPSSRVTRHSGLSMIVGLPGM